MLSLPAFSSCATGAGTTSTARTIPAEGSATETALTWYRPGLSGAVSRPSPVMTTPGSNALHRVPSLVAPTTRAVSCRCRPWVIVMALGSIFTWTWPLTWAGCPGPLPPHPVSPKAAKATRQARGRNVTRTEAGGMEIPRPVPGTWTSAKKDFRSKSI